jgi:Yip1 domain
MAQTTAPVAAGPAQKGLVARVLGIITSPRETFQSVVAHPRWFGVLALTAVIIAVCAALPMTTDEGKQSALDQQVRSMESMGFTVSDQMYDQMQRGMGRAPFTAGIGALVFAPIMAVVLAGLLWAIFNAAMGGDASFKQVLAIVVHAGVISTLGALFAAPINYLRGTMTGGANLRVLLPMIDENTFVGRLLGGVDLFLIWWVFVLAIGLAVLYRRRTQPIALTLLAIYAVIVVGIAAVMSRGGGA